MKMLIQIIDEENSVLIELRNNNGSISVDGFGFSDTSQVCTLLEAAAEGIPVVLNATASQLRHDDDAEDADDD